MRFAFFCRPAEGAVHYCLQIPLPHFLAEFSDWMLALSPFWAYVAVLVIAYGENVVPPIPGDLVVVYGGYLAGTGRLNFLLVVVLATLGGALGFMTMYGIGSRIGHAVLDPERLQWMPKERVRRVHEWLEIHGYWVVLGNRFLSGARSVIALAVGVAEMSTAKVFVFATLSALLWTVLITYAGYALGENWHFVGEYLNAYGRIVLGVTVGGVLVYFAWKYRSLLLGKPGRRGGDRNR